MLHALIIIKMLALVSILVVKWLQIRTHTDLTDIFYVNVGGSYYWFILLQSTDIHGAVKSLIDPLPFFIN